MVLSVTLMVSAMIGIYYRRQKNAHDFLLAEGKMSPVPVAFSLMASFMSAITLLGVTNENYAFGTQFMIINLSYAVATPAVAYLFIPVFFRLESPSAYAYLEKRFGSVTRVVASMAFSLQMILYMGIVLYAPALALSAVTELSFLGSILSVGLVCTFYSTLGGIRAVLITDVFQALLMFAAIGCVAIGGTLQLGGFENVLYLSRDRLEFFNFDPNPTTRHTFWTQAIGGIFTFLSIYAVNQAQVQRLLSTNTIKNAQRAIWLQLPILATLSFSTSFAGLVLYAYYKGCDPVKLGRIVKGDQLLPLFVVETMSNIPGLAGLFISGIFSGSLSTMSSAINSLAAVTLEDYIKKVVDVKAESETCILKALAIGYGLVSILLTFLVEFLGPGVLQASLTIFGVVGGPLLGLFSLGMMTTRANQKGALLGLVTSLALLFWIGFGTPRPTAVTMPLLINGTNCIHMNQTVMMVQQGASSPMENDYFWPYQISYAWYAMIGTFVTFVVGYVASIAIFCDQSNIHPDLLMGPIRKRLLVKSNKNVELLPIAE